MTCPQSVRKNVARNAEKMRSRLAQKRGAQCGKNAHTEQKRTRKSVIEEIGASSREGKCPYLGERRYP